MNHKPQLWKTVLAPLCGALLIGCGESIPSDPHATILMCERPENLDLSNIKEFEVLFDGVDPRLETPTLRSEEQVHITGSLLLKPDMAEPGDGLNLVIGYRPIVDGVADWSVPPCETDQRVEWIVGNRTSQQRGEIVSTLDKQRSVRLQPREYELRFYAIRENRVSDAQPFVYHIGRGKMLIVADEEADGE